jgi:hypothetical protein
MIYYHFGCHAMPSFRPGNVAPDERVTAGVLQQFICIVLLAVQHNLFVDMENKGTSFA